MPGKEDRLRFKPHHARKGTANGTLPGGPYAVFVEMNSSPIDYEEQQDDPGDGTDQGKCIGLAAP